MGFMEESPVARLYRDVKINEIGEGTSEVQRILIARHLLRPFEVSGGRPCQLMPSSSPRRERRSASSAVGSPSVPAVDLGARVIREVLERTGTDPAATSIS